jgi:hypothetical protein
LKSLYTTRTDEHLDDLLPRGESVNQDVGGLELVGSSVLLDLMGWMLANGQDPIIIVQLTKDWFLDMVDPCRLETEVVRDMASSLLPP